MELDFTCYMVELTALSSRIMVEQMHFLNFYVSRGSATRF